MRASDILGSGFGNLGRRKSRTVLTLVGVVIGVAALVLLISLGIGLQREVLKVFQGEDELLTIHVARLKPDTGKGKKPGKWRFDLGGGSIPVTDKDVEELRKLPGVAAVTPNFNLILDVAIADDNLGPLPVAAAGPDEAARFKPFLQHGTLWTSPDERACLVPSRLLEVRSDLAPDQVVGKTIVFSRGEDSDDIDPRTFKIVGVLDSEKMGFRGRMFYVPWDPGVDLRHTTQGGILPFAYKKGSYQDLNVRATGPAAVPDLQQRLKNMNFEAMTAADFIGMIDKVFLVVQGVMGCIGAIGLIVALFGIANTMAMSVMERTREIGIMKALGARNRDILAVFLVEAGSIGLIGGLLGLGLGAVGAATLGWAARAVVDVPESVTLFHVAWWLALGALGFSMIVSVAAGMVPALRGARLDPVRALRYE
jgi:putative ABC transport system permease protein